MKKKSAKHNLKRVQLRRFADILEEGRQRYERDLELATSRPVPLISLLA